MLFLPKASTPSIDFTLTQKNPVPITKCEQCLFAPEKFDIGPK